MQTPETQNERNGRCQIDTNANPLTGVTRTILTLILTYTLRLGLIAPQGAGSGALDAVTGGGLETNTDASVRKVTRNEYEWRLLFAMCLLLWQLDSWTGVAFWIIERLFE